ncbi:hypothetical protein [Nostoc sp. NIES-3756]|uniref:hypothetical protein n=1 Tax=Nostoc sp. NIES-3756 TaxID=1751286 RepID=UPI0008347CFD|nr:hypothetical protein [Nostoc sp. NIES-3756]
MIFASPSAIASQQRVADTFAQTGVIPFKVNVAPLWDGTFTNAINQCKEELIFGERNKKHESCLNM